MRIFTLLVLFTLLLVSSQSFSQFDKPSFQVGIGLTEPFDNFKGSNYLVNGTYQGYPTALVDSNLFKSTYAAKTGFNIFGAGKINFDKYNILRAVGFISYNSFNTFQSKQSGNQIILVNGNPTPISLTYNYKFSAFCFGLGLEVAPTSFTNIITPYFGANISFNELTASLERVEGSNTDTNRFSASGFRIGINFNAGIEAKFTKNFGLSLGIKYDLGNLLLKNTSNYNIAERYEWGQTNAALNDDEGGFYSNLPNLLSDPNFKSYSSSKKNINWGTVYLALNYYLNIPKTTKKAPQKK